MLSWNIVVCVDEELAIFAEAKSIKGPVATVDVKATKKDVVSSVQQLLHAI